MFGTLGVCVLARLTVSNLHETRRKATRLSALFLGISCSRRRGSNNPLGPLQYTLGFSLRTEGNEKGNSLSQRKSWIFKKEPHFGLDLKFRSRLNAFRRGLNLFCGLSNFTCGYQKEGIGPPVPTRVLSLTTKKLAFFEKENNPSLALKLKFRSQLNSFRWLINMF